MAYAQHMHQERVLNSYCAWFCSSVFAFKSLSLAIKRCESNWAIKAAPTLSCHYTPTTVGIHTVSAEDNNRTPHFHEFCLQFFTVSVLSLSIYGQHNCIVANFVAFLIKWLSLNFDSVKSRNRFVW